MSTTEGNRDISVDDYLNMMTYLGCDSFVSFNDEVQLSVGKRRGKQSVFRNKNWLQKHIEKAAESQGGIIANIQVTDNTPLLNEQLEIIKQNANSILGVNIGGLYLGENCQQRNSLLQYILSSIPENLVRFVTGPNTPFDVLESIRQGVDLTVCSYPIDLAEKAYLSWYEQWFED